MAKIAQKLPLDIYGALRPAVQRSQHKRVVFLVSSRDSKKNWMMSPKKLFWAKKLFFFAQEKVFLVAKRAVLAIQGQKMVVNH